MTFIDCLNFFIAGLIIGHFGPDFYSLCKRIVEEFKIAKKQWRGNE